MVRGDSLQFNFTPVDDMVNWLIRAQIIPKGHPLVWFHEIGTPVWMRDKSYPEVKQLVADRVLRITSHYGAKIPYYDINVMLSESEASCRI